MRQGVAYQKFINIDIANKTAVVVSNKGNRYPVTLSDLALYKNPEMSDTAVVKKINSKWYCVDVRKKEPVKQDDFDVAELWGEY